MLVKKFMIGFHNKYSFKWFKYFGKVITYEHLFKICYLYIMHLTVPIHKKNNMIKNAL